MPNQERDDYRDPEPEPSERDPNPRVFRICVGLLFIGVVLFYWLISIAIFTPEGAIDLCLMGVSVFVFIAGILFLRKGIFRE